jgi:putative zinc finger protein
VDGVHIGDDAELYALGALEPEERSAVEAHVATCAECAARVARAEAVAAQLATALPAYEPPPHLRARITGAAPNAMPLLRRIALAAAVVAFGFLALHDANLMRDRAATSASLATIVHSHFNHASMVGSRLGAPAAKVLYARDGAWVYVIVDHAVPGAHVFFGNGLTLRDMGTLRPSSGLATLFAQPAGRPDSVILRDAEGTLATVALKY